MSRFLLSLGLAVALAGCSTMQIASQFAQNADFKKYHTFAWNPVDPGPEQATDARDPAIRKLIFGTIEQELAPRGFKKAEPGAMPDFFIAVHGWARDKIEVKQYGYVYGTTAYGYVAGPSIEVNQNREGTLVIDFIDAGTKEMFWRGTASDTFTPETNRAAIKEAVVKLIDAYPPTR
jgi:hypothetical protein